LDRLAGVLDPQPRIGRKPLRRQLALDQLLPPYQSEGNRGIALQDVQHGGPRDWAAVVAAPAPDGDRPCQPLLPPPAPVLTERAGSRRACGNRGVKSLFGLGLEALLARVVAVRADVVTQVHFAGRRLESQRRVGERVVRAVHAALRWRLPVLLYRHGYCSFSF